jgi:hypothetical protein
LGAGGILIDGGGFGNGGAIDDGIGENIEERGGERGFIGEIQQAAGAKTGNIA